MIFKFKKIFFILILIMICSSFFGVEKTDPVDNINTVSFNYLNDSQKINQNNNLNDLKKLYTYTGFQSSLYRTGLYMVGFGGACAMLGGALFGLSYLVKWYLANSIGWAFEEVVSNIFILESVFSIHSYYTTVAIAFWITGIVLMGISAIIIPGIIIMVIGKVMSAQRVKPLKEAVGFAIQF